MSLEKDVLCGPCLFDDVTKDAGRWCTNCEEGLCRECENVHRKGKTTRNHKVITIDDYRKIEHVSISQICEQHGENLEWFCKSHDEVLCVVCVPSKHKTCSDVIPISANSANSGQSSALNDLEETIEGTLRNVQQCIKNRESATKEIEKQELEVRIIVLDTRTKINVHLDKLEENLLNELRSKSCICKSKYKNILEKLKSTEEMLTKFREQSIHIKQFSSDIQVFLGTRQINKQILDEIKTINTELGVSKNYALDVSFHSLIKKLSNEVEDFGKMFVSESATNLDFRDSKIDQAQIEINIPTPRNISDIKLQLIKSFQMAKTHYYDKLNVSDCVILPNGHLMIANDTNDKLLIEYSDTGKLIRDIRVSGPPYAIDVIDRDRIVVTYGASSYLEIMNNNYVNVDNKISLHKSCWGVSHADMKLYVAQGDCIQVLDLSGRQLKTIKTASESVSRIYLSNEKIVYSDWDSNIVHCCHLNGNEFWHFEHDSINFPRDITADCYNNVFVVSHNSENLTTVQHDGKNSKTLLTTSDGLRLPRTAYYDKGNRTLVICNDGGKVLLFKVV
ncbi:uncharacterized protein [Mytilus edulis]|uniref:uncharacterized protein n=1 Tax=Mytilus edulis TaxID=6550 RepID=UPI0039F13CA9